MHNQVQLEFGDGDYLFALNAREIEELQRLCGQDGKPHGFGAIFQRMMLGTWFHQDVFQTIRLGLEGGGMAPVEARRIADRYAVPPYRPEHIGGAETTARLILKAAMHGMENLPPGEAPTPKD